MLLVPALVHLLKPVVYPPWMYWLAGGAMLFLVIAFVVYLVVSLRKR